MLTFHISIISCDISTSPRTHPGTSPWPLKPPVEAPFLDHGIKSTKDNANFTQQALAASLLNQVLQLANLHLNATTTFAELDARLMSLLGTLLHDTSKSKTPHLCGAVGICIRALQILHTSHSTGSSDDDDDDDDEDEDDKSKTALDALLTMVVDIARYHITTSHRDTLGPPPPPVVLYMVRATQTCLYAETGDGHVQHRLVGAHQTLDSFTDVFHQEWQLSSHM
jgi:hypothetical protein